MKLWDANELNEIRTFNGHNDYVLCCSISPNVKTILSGSRDKSLILWGVQSGNKLKILNGHTGAVIKFYF